MVDLLNLAPCGIFSFSEDGVILQVNDTICSLVKMPREQIVGQKVNCIFTLPTIIFYQTHFYPLLKIQHFVEEIFITLKTKEGQEVPVLLSAKRIVSPDQLIENICSCLPIYNRKNYEDELIAAKKQAEKDLQENLALVESKIRLQQQVTLLDEKMYQLQQRNAELKDLSSTISHDLQEPSRKLLFFSDMLLQGKSKTSLEQTLQRVINQTLRLKQLLIGLQDWMILDNSELKTEDVDVADVLLKAKQRLLVKYKGLDLELDTDPLPRIKANREQLTILFYELLSNAVKFRNPDRPLKVTIETTMLHHNQFKALNDRYHYSEHCKIVFKDNGKGFHEKYKDQVFQLFKKLEKDTPGLGIGLTLCKKIVTNHHGSLGVISKEGEGSCFEIYLPFYP